MPFRELVGRVRAPKLLLWLCLGLTVMALIKTAWIHEDAYITFRTIDNALHGYGLTWNVVERVQVYTHPLWMFVLMMQVAVTGDVYSVAIWTGTLCTLLTVYLLVTRVCPTALTGLAATVLLLISRAFVDYSTSGLENSLTHLLLIAAVVLYLQPHWTRSTLLQLTILGSLGACNRLDSALLFAPLVAAVLWHLRSAEAVKTVALGALPFLAWELFSIFYYGSFVPNTAYAKLATGIDRMTLVAEGWDYIMHSVLIDRVTVATIVIGLCLGFSRHGRGMRPLAAAAALYLLYIIWIGGCYMAGRFLTPAFLLTVIIIARQVDLPLRWCRAAVPMLVLTLLSFPHPSWFGSVEFVEPHMYYNGSLNEFATYYPSTGFLPGLGQEVWPQHGWRFDGERVKASGVRSVVSENVGFFGFAAGTGTFIVDPLGITDPLIARIPLLDKNGVFFSGWNWAPGHYPRVIPEGYLQTVDTGVNQIADKALAAYYDKLELVIRGPLFSPARWVAIWQLNTGAFDPLMSEYVAHAESNQQFAAPPTELQPVAMR